MKELIINAYFNITNMYEVIVSLVHITKVTRTDYILIGGALKYVESIHHHYKKKDFSFPNSNNVDIRM